MKAKWHTLAGEGSKSVTPPGFMRVIVHLRPDAELMAGHRGLGRPATTPLSLVTGSSQPRRLGGLVPPDGIAEMAEEMA